MICPRCGETLQRRVERGVTVDQCPSCGGVWLDKGELDVLVKADDQGLFGRLFGGGK
jgi:Zn-finger nucleic acid-binding protein